MSNLESVKKYQSTIKGKASVMWNDIKKRVNREARYKNILLQIKRDDFIQWVSPKLEEWVKSKPLRGRDGASIDRIDNNGHYSLDNIQLISYRDNCKKQGKRYKTPDGFHWCSRCQDYLLEVKFSSKTAQVCRECNKAKCKKRYAKSRS